MSRSAHEKLAVVILLSGALAAQPAFEVASVKRFDIFNAHGRKPGLSISGNRVSLVAMPLTSLVAEAYGVRPYQVSGGPAWANDSVQGSWEILAKTEGETTPTREQVRSMLQTLLADRFQLQLRRETKDLPVYELVVGKKGPKLAESGADAVFSNRQGSSGQTIHMAAVHNTMAQLVNIMSPYVNRPVLDKTGLAGAYDFTMEFVTEGPHGPQAADASDPSAPSIFIAVEEQLGLKLVPQKRPTEILLIGRAEKPSEN